VHLEKHVAAIPDVGENDGSLFKDANTGNFYDEGRILGNTGSQVLICMGRIDLQGTGRKYSDVRVSHTSMHQILAEPGYELTEFAWKIAY
jgi:hypothetical protein